MLADPLIVRIDGPVFVEKPVLVAAPKMSFPEGQQEYSGAFGNRYSAEFYLYSFKVRDRLPLVMATRASVRRGSLDHALCSSYCNIGGHSLLPQDKFIHCSPTCKWVTTCRCYRVQFDFPTTGRPVPLLIRTRRLAGGIRGNITMPRCPVQMTRRYATGCLPWPFAISRDKHGASS